MENDSVYKKFLCWNCIEKLGVTYKDEWWETVPCESEGCGSSPVAWVPVPRSNPLLLQEDDPMSFPSPEFPELGQDPTPF